MNPALAWRIARRELRGGIAGFRVLVACLALGVAAIAAIGLIRSGIAQGLAGQGRVILGGDAQMGFTYRYAKPEELAFMHAHARKVSAIVTFRSMVVTGRGDSSQSALSDVKGVDANYPLTGAVGLSPAMPVAQALAVRDGVPGAVMDPVLAARLGLRPGGLFRLGRQEFRLSALLTREPDAASAGFQLGPRTIVATGALAKSGLLAPGTLFDSKYRLLLAPGADLARLQALAEAKFRNAGMRWTDRRNAAPGVARFVDRMGSFLVLVGLAGLAVGGVGVSSAVRAYLEAKIATIATLKSLGASGDTIFLVYLFQIGALALVGIALGLVMGAGGVLVLAPLLGALLPFPADFAIYAAPLVTAAVYGILAALLFTLWPLARAERVQPAALYRAEGGAGSLRAGLPRGRYLAAELAVLATLVGAVVWRSGLPGLSLVALAGIAVALGLLLIASWGLRRVARRLARSRAMRGHSALRLALGAIGGRREEAAMVMLSLGLGLSVMAAVGQVDGNLRAAIAQDLPQRAPSFFFIDIQPGELHGFLDRVESDPGVSRVDTAPMLRGVITRINGRPARAVAGDHWVVRGDRGISMSDTPPAHTRITAGKWWPANYNGPPQISFAAKEAAEIGLKLGDTMTVNILGRDIKATVTSFRDVNFRNAAMGFVVIMDPAALAGAPHSDIATVYASPESEAALLRDIARAYPNITAIRVRDAIDQVTQALSAIASAVAGAAGATVIVGIVVLIGAAAAAVRMRVYEAAVLKTLGASHGRILSSMALRSLILGAAAGAMAIVAGGLAGWAVMTQVMHLPYRFQPLSALVIVILGIAAVVGSGLLFALRPLRARPARVLRAQE